MDTGRLHARALIPALGCAVLACLFSRPAPAGDDMRVVPLFSDGRGSQAWVEFESSGGRTTATPFVATGGEGLKKFLENPDGSGTLAVPVPGLSRLVERARRALRERARPAAVETVGAGTNAPEAQQPPADAQAAPAGSPEPESPPAAGLTGHAVLYCENCDFRARAAGPTRDRVAAGDPGSVTE